MTGRRVKDRYKKSILLCVIPPIQRPFSRAKMDLIFVTAVKKNKIGVNNTYWNLCRLCNKQCCFSINKILLLWRGPRALFASALVSLRRSDQFSRGASEWYPTECPTRRSNHLALKIPWKGQYQLTTSFRFNWKSLLCSILIFGKIHFSS